MTKFSKGMIQLCLGGLETLKVNVYFSRLGLKLTCGHLFVFGLMLSVNSLYV